VTAPVLVIVSGTSGAGKTTLARRVAADLCLPVIAKDDIKERLFESLGWSDRAWSMKLGAATWDLLFLLTDELLAVGANVIIESNFDRQLHGGRLKDLARRHPHEVIELHCTAEAETLSARVQTRARHPGHNPEGNDSYTPEVAEAGLHRHEPLGFGRLVEVDTTDPEQIDWKSIIAIVREELGG
jgi:predicted kinase